MIDRLGGMFAAELALRSLDQAIGSRLLIRLIYLPGSDRPGADWPQFSVLPRETPPARREDCALCYVFWAIRSQDPSRREQDRRLIPLAENSSLFDDEVSAGGGCEAVGAECRLPA